MVAFQVVCSGFTYPTQPVEGERTKRATRDFRPLLQPNVLLTVPPDIPPLQHEQSPLIHHGVADARAHGAGPVVIATYAEDTAKRLYAALGFQPVAVVREWVRQRPVIRDNNRL